MDKSCQDFVGAKLALLCPGGLVTYLRDDRPGLPFAGQWDFAGGGREGDETPEACALRETEEEFGLRLPPDALIWKRRYPGMLRPHEYGWFFVARLNVAQLAAIRFGDEGQRWEVWSTQRYLSDPLAIPALQDRLRAYLAEASEPGSTR